MDGLDIFNVYVMGSIEMLTVFHFFTRFLKKKVKFIYYILRLPIPKIGFAP